MIIMKTYPTQSNFLLFDSANNNGLLLYRERRKVALITK